MDLKRFEGENEIAYIARICEAKDMIGSWEDVKDIINKNLNDNKSSSTYRKMYQSFKKIYAVHMDKLTSDQKMLEEIKEQRYLLEREKIKFRDERNAFNRMQSGAARAESLFDLFERKIDAYIPNPISEPMVYDIENNFTAIVHLTDVHGGLAINNSWNEYSPKIMEYRLREYYQRAEEIIKRHKCRTCYLVLGGDLISGLIHLSIRIENRENIVEQLINVSEAISKFAAQLAEIVDCLRIVAVAGNHSRAVANKDAYLKGENLDELIPFYMQTKLANYKNIEFLKNTIDESIASFFVEGKLAYAVHGDKDTPQQVVQRLTMCTGRKPDFIFMGHRHTNALTTVYNTKVIESGCLSGTDSYAIDNRLVNAPEQTITVCGKDGLVCCYDIRFK